MVNAEKLKTALLTVGDCLTEKETAEFFKEAKPQADGNLPYDGNLSVLSYYLVSLTAI